MPHAALVSSEPPSLRSESAAGYRVLALHGEIEGKLPTERHSVEYGGAVVDLREVGPKDWSYVALGHYHVQHKVAPNTWYAGSLEYVGLNIWGQLARGGWLRNWGRWPSARGQYRHLSPARPAEPPESPGFGPPPVNLGGDGPG